MAERNRPRGAAAEPLLPHIAEVEPTSHELVIQRLQLELARERDGRRIDQEMSSLRQELLDRARDTEVTTQRAVHSNLKWVVTTSLSVVVLVLAMFAAVYFFTQLVNDSPAPQTELSKPPSVEEPQPQKPSVPQTTVPK